jgi:hypothetical protein
MKILQVVTTYGQNCGIAFFASHLQEQMEKIGIEVKTVSTVNGDLPSADILLLQHHSDLLNHESVSTLCERSRCPVVLFAHSDGIDMLSNKVDGFVAMCPGMIPETDRPTHVFPHPTWIPECLEDRTVLRKRFGLPIKSMIIGANGFLKFERQFVEILNILLPYAKDNNWFVDLMTSPWYIDSPSLIPKFEKLQSTYSTCFRFEYAYLNKEILNQKLQACDLLWCWTRAPSSPYASGVISDQYASGTRIFAADKLQHRHVLKLPNVIRGSDRLEPFIEQLIVEIKRNKRNRHDPSPISWDRCIDELASFLTGIGTERGNS